MDCKKEVYPSSNSWFGKVSTLSWGDRDIDLFSKYYEPTINVGGTISDGTVSFTLTSVTKKVKSDSPFGTEFNPTTLGISLAQAGERATAFVNVMVGRIETAMDSLRATDSTSVERTTWKVV